MRIEQGGGARMTCEIRLQLWKLMHRQHFFFYCASTRPWWFVRERQLHQRRKGNCVKHAFHLLKFALFSPFHCNMDICEVWRHYFEHAQALLQCGLSKEAVRARRVTSVCNYGSWCIDSISFFIVCPLDAIWGWQLGSGGLDYFLLCVHWALIIC